MVNKIYKYAQHGNSISFVDGKGFAFVLQMDFTTPPHFLDRSTCYTCADGKKGPPAACFLPE